MSEPEEDWVTFARIVALSVVGIVGVIGASAAWSQAIQPLQPLAPLGGGYTVSPDGGVSSWQGNSGYVIGPLGNGSWSPDGGYFVAPDGSVSSWSGPLPVILPDGRLCLT